MKPLTDLNIKIFADGADLDGIRELVGKPYIHGITTNPTLMRRVGVRDYRIFAQNVLGIVGEKPVSFEVLADDFAMMERQALEISGWGKNIYVKIPIMTSSGECSAELIQRLMGQGVKVNITALFTLRQVYDVIKLVEPEVPCIFSILAGRIADTGRDPLPIMAAAVEALKPFPAARLLWASPRETLNIIQADQIGCQIIAVTHDILKKLNLLGKDLDQFTRETVQMFVNDAQSLNLPL
jgi:transaldolase